MFDLQVILKGIVMRVSCFLSTPHLESLICRIITSRIGRVSSAEALSFLFRLDTAIYLLEGQKAIDYNGGIHTKHRHTRYHDFFIQNIRPDERVLDIGCGIGALAYDIAERSRAQVTAIDLKPEAIAKASQHYKHPRVRYLVGDVMQKLPDGPFDVIILSNVLEHMKERSEFLVQLQRASSPSRLLIRVPLFERDWRVPLKKELGVEWRLDPTHKTEYTMESFLEEIAAAGLRITHQEIRWSEIWAEAVPSEEAKELC
jgi:ubiquinone/menaquinone biosynthesis C-methylase UbiE